MDDLYASKRAVIGIVGLGYVGMPLAMAAWTSGFRVIGFDVDREKVDRINAGTSYLRQVPGKEVASALAAGAEEYRGRRCGQGMGRGV